MADPCGKTLDPRILRTRQGLQGALETLLLTRSFEDLSVQDITDAATVNRATFYAHYPDKFALLACLVGSRFGDLLAHRGITYEGTCAWALRQIVITVCDYMAAVIGPEPALPRRIEPPMESAIIAVIRSMLLAGIRSHPGCGASSAEIRAATASWAIYGGAKEWVQTAAHRSSEEAADLLLPLLASILPPAPAPSSPLGAGAD